MFEELITVIVPVYNVALYLEEAIDSVVHQNYRNLEIILVDDGSTDGSGEICDRYAGLDQRICVIHQENKGLSAARNAGLDVMNGSAVAFLDSDDAYYPEYVTSMAEAMIHEGADLVVCGYTVHCTDGRMNPSNQMRDSSFLRQNVYNRIGALKALADGTINHTAWNKLYCTELWKDIRYPEGHVYEDIDTTYRVLNVSKRVCVLETPLYLHRKRAGSITDSNSREYIQDRILAQTHFISFMAENTPKIFATEQQENVKRLWAVRLISYYNHLKWDEDKSFRDNIRAMILELGNEVGVQQIGLQMRICYWMIRYCPRLEKTSYSIKKAVNYCRLKEKM